MPDTIFSTHSPLYTVRLIIKVISSWCTSAILTPSQARAVRPKPARSHASIIYNLYLIFTVLSGGMDVVRPFANLLSEGAAVPD